MRKFDTLKTLEVLAYDTDDSANYAYWDKIRKDPDRARYPQVTIRPEWRRIDVGQRMNYALNRLNRRSKVMSALHCVAETASWAADSLRYVAAAGVVTGYRYAGKSSKTASVYKSFFVCKNAAGVPQDYTPTGAFVVTNALCAMYDEENMSIANKELCDFECTLCMLHDMLAWISEQCDIRFFDLKTKYSLPGTCSERGVYAYWHYNIVRPVTGVQLLKRYHYLMVRYLYQIWSSIVSAIREGHSEFETARVTAMLLADLFMELNRVDVEGYGIVQRMPGDDNE